MSKKFNHWIIGLGAAGTGVIPAFLPFTQRSCTGICGSCGAICIPGILVAGWLLVSCLYRRMTAWISAKPRSEACHEQ